MKTFSVLVLLTSVVFGSNLNADSGLIEKIQQAQREQKSSKVSKTLLDIQASLEQPQTLPRNRTLPASHDNFIAIEILFVGNVSKAVNALSALGMKNLVTTDTVISGRILLEELSSLENFNFIKAVRHNKVLTNSGAVTSEGVRATNSGDIPRVFGVTGKGVLVGVISDSYDCLGGEQADIASGDVPAGVVVLDELEDCSTGSDEGRALIQIIYDFASEAEFVFGTGLSSGRAEVAELIHSMVNDYNVDIIVDDTSSLLEPFFQEGLVYSAVESAVAQGVNYVMSAGNSGNFAYEGLFSESYNAVLNLTAHDFDPGEDVSFFQNITIPSDEFLELVLQWDEPAYSISGGDGSESDLDIFLLNTDGSVLYASAASDNLGQDPLEYLSFYNEEAFGETQFQLLIVHAQGRTPSLLKYIISSRFTGSIDDHYTGGGTIYGRANSASGISVGATAYDLTIEFGHDTNEVQFYSSVGGIPILFDGNGERISDELLVRRKPDLTAPDGVNTTFFAEDDTDGDGLPNFQGTSASAPHVGGIIALMLEANPELDPAQIQHILQTTSTDIVLSDGVILPSGFDFVSGYGLANGAAAVSAAIAWQANEPAPISSNLPYELFSSANNTSVDEQNPTNSVTVGGSVSLITLLSVLLFCPMAIRGARRKKLISLHEYL